MTRGLVLGKFAPLHHGHELLIRNSLASTDETVVLVYEAKTVSRIPIETRAGWIRRLFPQVQVIEGHDSPEAAGHDPAVMKLQEDYIRSVVPAPITHFFSSEWYGDHVSRALGAIDVRVDPARGRVPVSGTLLRQDPFAHRAHVSPIVYRDLVRWIVLLGAESTGKTTLAEHLAHEFQTAWLPEFGRDYWERNHAADGTLTPVQLVELAQIHREQEEGAVLDSHRLFFADTDARITRLYSRWYHNGLVRPELDRLAEEATQRYHLTVLCGDDIDYHDDGTRAGADRRRQAQTEIRSELEAAGTPWIEVRGSFAERAAAVRGAVERLGLLAWC